MFSGIVEATTSVIGVESFDSALRLDLGRPAHFDDLKVGDSIAVDGVCLTLESFTNESLQFTVGPETMAITGWLPGNLPARLLNLERSLRLQDRIHGHLVSGHVDGQGVVEAIESLGECKLIEVLVPSHLSDYVWVKGSCALNGVSLTINEKNSFRLKFCVIPETLRRTNLGSLIPGQIINFEADWMAKGLVAYLQDRRVGFRETERNS